MATLSCGEGKFAFANSCILTNDAINKYIKDVLLPDVYIPTKKITADDFKFYKSHINTKYGTYSTFEEFQDGFFASAFPIDNASNKDNYIVSMWKKMLTICNVLNEDELEEPIIEPSSTKEELLQQLVTCKVYASRKTIGRKTRALITKINEVMDLLLTNMYEVLTFDGRNNNGITPTGFDVFLEYGLDAFVPKPKFLKDKFANIRILKKRDTNGDKVQYSQQPYGEIQSFKLKKDVANNEIFQGMPTRNVRIGNNDMNNTNYIASKFMWYKLKKIDGILFNIQRMFDIVKTFYANGTINFSLTLNEVYPLPTEFADVYGPKIEDRQLLEYVQVQLKTLKDKKYAPTSARLYGLVSEFMDNVLKEAINEKTIDIFVQSVEDTLSIFNSLQIGGGFFNKVMASATNISIVVFENVKKLTLIAALNISDGLRSILDMSGFVAIAISMAKTIGTCGMAATKSVFSMFATVGIDSVKCAMAVYTTYLSMSQPKVLIQHIQAQMRIALQTTDFLCLIVQFGMFKDMHDVLLEKLEEIAGYDTILDENINRIQNEIQVKFTTLYQQWESKSLDAQNIYLLHGKIQVLLQKRLSSSKMTKGLEYMIQNTPTTTKDLRLMMKYMLGDVDDLYDFFPSSLSLLAQREMATFYKKNFPIPDMQKFIAVSLLKQFDLRKYDEKQYITNYYKLGTSSDFSLMKSLFKNGQDPPSMAMPLNNLYFKDDNNAFVNVQKYVDSMMVSSLMSAKHVFYWCNIDYKLKQVKNYEVEDIPDAQVMYYNYIECAMKAIIGKHVSKIKNNDIDNAYIAIIRDLNGALSQLDYKVKYNSFTLTDIPSNICDDSKYVNFVKGSLGKSAIVSAGGKDLRKRHKLDKKNTSERAIIKT